jgi:hypothetical protein
MKNPINRKDDCVADVESDLEKHIRIEDPKWPEMWDVGAPLHGSRLIQPTPNPRGQAE